MGTFELWLLFSFIPSLNLLGGFVVLVGTIAGIFGSIFYTTHLNGVTQGEENVALFIKSKVKAFVVIYSIALMAAFFVPSKEEIALIVGGSYATQIEGAENLPPNIVKSMNKALESYIE